MLEFSPGVTLGWQIAASEAGHSKHQYIEPDHLFIGICSLEKVLMDKKVIDTLPRDVVHVIESENNEIIDVFWNLKVDIRQTRRKVREYLGSGNYDSQENVVHRSEESKTIFKKAEEIANRQNSPMVRAIHLLTAILENHGPNIEKTFNLYDMDLDQFKNEALSISEKQPVGITTSQDKLLGHNKSSSALETYGTDLTALAKAGEVDSLIGRDEELIQVIQTLSKKKKSNPLLIGEAGVGKTAIVRGLAKMIVEGNAPSNLQDKRIIELNMGTIVAGTKYRGEFEDRLTQIIKEASKDPNIILFIDEIHTVVGAGSGGGSLDASNILKPALAQGDIKCIGATTIAEYRKYFENDSALERRFQPVNVEEPSSEDTIAILIGLRKEYEEHHKVKIHDSAIDSAVNLSIRYLHDRRLPDKALDLLDEACSRKSIQTLNLSKNETRNDTIIDEDIISILEEQIGVPIKIKDEEKENLLKIKDILRQRVIGQDDAIDRVARRIRISRSGLQEPNRPSGVFLFLGPTGVGKTELAKTLSFALFGSEKNMIRLDMSEYMEKHSVSKLIGAPPGYVGHEEEGYLTGALRTNPYSIVLLDEIEKAHPEIFDVFLQLFDEGIITDAKGRTIDANNAIFIMTSNVSPQVNEDYGRAYGIPEGSLLESQKILKGLTQMFRPEFLNRIDEIAVFNPLGRNDIKKIANIRLGELSERVAKKGINIEIGSDVLAYISKVGYDENFGARPLRRVIEKKVESPLSERIISEEIKEGDSIKVSMKDNEIHISLLK